MVMPSVSKNLSLTVAVSVRSSLPAGVSGPASGTKNVPPPSGTKFDTLAAATFGRVSSWRTSSR